MKNKFENLPEKITELKSEPKPACDVLADYYAALGDGTLELLGVKTGFDILDRMTLGLDGLIVLGGIAGQGKTTLALQIAFNACNYNTPTLFYSLAVPHRAVLTKVLSRLAKVGYAKVMLNGREGLGGQQKMAFDKGKERLASIGKKFYIRSRERGDAEIGLAAVEHEINFLKEKHNADRVFVVIDTLHSLDAGSHRDHVDKDEKLMNGLKAISMRTGSTILLVSHMSKTGFNKGDTAHSINWSAPIVYLADVVMFLEDSMKDENEMGKIISSSFSDGREVNLVDLIIAKNRYNSPGKIRLQFNGRFSEFTELPGQTL